jgi:hypothetical protein
MNKIHQFLNKENIQVLWDVLIEEQVIKDFCSSHSKIMELTKIFEANLKGFYDIERKNCNTLVELNKKYILLIINYLNSKLIQNKTLPNITHSQQPQQQNQTQFKKIKIHDELIKQPITFEEIQNERKSQFEKDLQDKQQEFMNAMTLPVPPVPNFSDEIDEPLSEIETKIKNIQKQRNYDIEIINKNYQNQITENQLNTNDWLKSENTNIKNEKHISWEDNNNNNVVLNQVNEFQDEQPKFFSKLKKKSENNIQINMEDSYSVTSNIQNQVNYNISIEINDLKSEVNKLNDKLNYLLEKIDKFINFNIS